jgi:hypothetical protein
MVPKQTCSLPLQSRRAFSSTGRLSHRSDTIPSWSDSRTILVLPGILHLRISRGRCLRTDWTESKSPQYCVIPRLKAYKSSYGGDLSLVLDGTSKFTLSNDILILPREYVASDGAFETDSSAPGILFAPTSNDNVNDVSIVGRPFFSAAYIMVDLDAETWTLWQANATTDTRLVSVGEECAERPKVNTSPPKITPPGVVPTNATIAPTDNATDISTASTPEGQTTTGLGGGAIAGVVVGAVVGSGLLAAALVICWMRRRQQTKRSASETDIALTKYGHESEQLTPMWHEKPAESAQELPSARIPAHELPVRERPIEAPGRYWDGQVVELPGVLTPKT